MSWVAATWCWYMAYRMYSWSFISDGSRVMIGGLGFIVLNHPSYLLLHEPKKGL